MSKFLIMNGPNLNMLGVREPDIYGTMGLGEIQVYTAEKLKGISVDLEWFQSNCEGELIDKIHWSLSQNFKAIVINPGAYSHTSVAIYDALQMANCPVIEVHLSNTNMREDFRGVKLTARASKIVMEGLGKDAYYLAVYSQIHSELK